MQILSTIERSSRNPQEASKIIKLSFTSVDAKLDIGIKRKRKKE
jgi:hypothetical protein